MKTYIDMLSIAIIAVIGYLFILWGGGTAEHINGYLDQLPWIGLSLLAGMVLIFCYVRKANMKERYFQVLIAFIRYICLCCAFRARMGGLDIYFGIPEYGIFLLLTLLGLALFKIFQRWMMTGWGCMAASAASVILLLLSMGKYKTGRQVLGVNVQLPILVVALDLLIIFPALLGDEQILKNKKKLMFSFILLAIQCVLFLEASECGTMLVLLISFWMVWMRFCKLHHMKKVQFFSLFVVIGGSCTVFGYVSHIYERLENYAGRKDLSLLQDIAVKAAGRLFQTDPYQYESGIKAVWRGGLLGKGREYLVDITNALADLPLLHSIQIFGLIVLCFILPMLLQLMRNMVFANNEEAGEEKDGYSQLRDEGILGFFVSSILINLFSEMTGVIIGIPLLFLSRASSWNLIGCVLIMVYISTPDMTGESMENLKDKYYQCLKVSRG